MLHPVNWNSGLMSEAITAVIDFGFNQIKLHTIEARINPANVASSKILLKHSFIKEDTLKKAIFITIPFSIVRFIL